MPASTAISWNQFLSWRWICLLLQSHLALPQLAKRAHFKLNDCIKKQINPEAILTLPLQVAYLSQITWSLWGLLEAPVLESVICNHRRKQKSSQKSFFEPLQKHVLGISKGPIESVILVFINIHYSYRTWVLALMLIRLFPFCNPFLSHIVNAGLGPPSVSVSLCVDFNKFSLTPQVLCTEEAERGLQACISSNRLLKSCWGSCIPLGACGAFLHGAAGKTGDEAKALGSHSAFAHCSCCQSLAQFVIYHVNHFHACFVLTDSSISSRLEHCRVGTFGKAVLLLPVFKDTFLNVE